MSKQLVKANGGAVAILPLLTPEQLKMLQQTVCAGHTLEQAQCFVEYCRAKGMDPFAREIYSIIRKGRQTFQIGIDALRKRAEETGQYEGQTPYYWCGPDGLWTDVWLVNAPPAAAKVGIYKRGWREPMWAIAKFAEYKPEDDWMWRKMPANQIAKCAEALALRRAFPSQLGGMYATEEMAQAGNGGTEQATQARAATLSERLGASDPTPEASAGPRIAPQAPVDHEQALRDAEALAAKVIDPSGGSASSGASVPDSTVNMDSEPDPEPEPGPDPDYGKDSAFGKMLQRFATAKAAIGPDAYYAILRRHGLPDGADGKPHANKFKNVRDGEAALADMTAERRVQRVRMLSRNNGGQPPEEVAKAERKRQKGAK